MRIPKVHRLGHRWPGQNQAAVATLLRGERCGDFLRGLERSRPHRHGEHGAEQIDFHRRTTRRPPFGVRQQARLAPQHASVGDYGKIATHDDFLKQFCG